MGDIYWNTHRKCFSHRVDGRVVEHLDDFHMETGIFLVFPRAQARVRRTRRKEIHAVIRGETRVSINSDLPASTRRVLYNPYIHDSFVDEADQPVLAGRSITGRVRDGRPEIFVE